MPLSTHDPCQPEVGIREPRYNPSFDPMNLFLHLKSGFRNNFLQISMWLYKIIYVKWLLTRSLIHYSQLIHVSFPKSPWKPLIHFSSIATSGGISIYQLVISVRRNQCLVPLLFSPWNVPLILKAMGCISTSSQAEVRSFMMTYLGFGRSQKGGWSNFDKCQEMLPGALWSHWLVPKHQLPPPVFRWTIFVIQLYSKSLWNWTEVRLLLRTYF